METIGKSPSDTKITSIKTSQTEFSQPGGKADGPGNGPNLYGDEYSPTGISTKVAMEKDNQLKTTQQLRGEYSLPES